MYVLNFIAEETIDFSEVELVAGDESVAVVEEDAVEEVEGVGFAVEIASTTAAGDFVVVDFDDVAVGEVQGFLEVDYLLGFH